MGGGHFYTFQRFLRSRYRMEVFLGPQNFKYFWVYLIFLIFLRVFFGGGGGRGAGGKQ